MSYYAALLDEVSVDVHLAEVIDDNGKLDAAAIVEYAVQQCGLSTAEVAGKE